MHLSNSQVNMLMRCGEQYRRRYIEGEKLPPGVALIRGSSIHEGAKHNYRQKIESHEDLPEDDIVDFTVEAYDRRVREDGVLLTPEEKSKGADAIIGDERDRVVRLSSLYANVAAPPVQPERVESEITVNFDNYDMLGIVDLITDKQEVIDYKTSKRKMPKGTQHADFQLTTYAALYYALNKKMPAGLAFDVLVDKKVPEVQTMPTSREVDDFETWYRTIEQSFKLIKGGIFIPTNKGNWWCGEKYCGYYASCPYISNSEKRRLHE